ncbi:hypothetical protein HG530_013961 [Fusarium avenaceum]|nr:hypothetical protein HG530_013961 [Fusarium avenaceum]
MAAKDQTMEPFNDQEKRHLLAEIIKHSQISVQVLETLIKSRGVEPNWMQVQLPNGRNMAQCLQTAHDMDILQRGMKRKAPGDSPEAQGSDDIHAPNSRELRLDIQLPTTPGSHANMQRLSHLQQSLSSELLPPPKKKKGRPAYAGREVSNQQPFSPRPIAPKPPAHTLPNTPSSFRPIAPSPHTILPPLPPDPLQTTYGGLKNTLPIENHRATGIYKTQKPIITSWTAFQRKNPSGTPQSLSKPGEEVHSHLRSQSEVVPKVIKQEYTESDRSSSMQPLKAKDHTQIKEQAASGQMQEGILYSGKENNE